MKTWQLPRFLRGSHLATAVLFCSALSGFAQAGSEPPIATNDVMPTVTIRATQPFTSVSGQPGTFTVFRAGNTNLSLLVYYRIGGTASNGVDYGQIGNWITIPGGATSNTISITGSNTVPPAAVETVIIELTPSPLAMPINYVIGRPNVATVYIEGSDVTNLPPAVKILTPADGATFTAPANILLLAAGSDPDGVVVTVEFFAGTNSLGVTSNSPVVLDPAPGGAIPMPPGKLFGLVWSNVPPGKYILTAKATDDGGATGISGPVQIVVVAPVIQPVVTIRASVPEAAEPCGTNDARSGKFTVHRSMGTNIDLTVWYAIGGTASNGVDYVAISNSVVIPQGAESADILITPLADDAAGVVETVVVQIQPPICPMIWPPPPDCYLVGEPAKAIVSVKDCRPVTNIPPLVRIISPPNKATFRAPVDVPIYAFARDADGSVATVEIFAGANSLGFAQSAGRLLTDNTNGPVRPFPTNVFFLTWSNAPIGSYVLTAKATDDGGAATVSAPVAIAILPPPPPRTNRPAIVSIVATDPVAIEGTNCWPLRCVSAWPTNADGAGIPITFSNFCAPKNADFTVRRSGSTNEDLTVSYTIGGTASNGVDYVALSGSLTIPAGKRHAEIAIVPIDDGPPDISSTVILKLAAATNYVLGFPRSAAAIILDGKWPRPPMGVLPDRCFHLASAGPDGAWFHLDYTTDLLHWKPLCTNQVVNGCVDFVDPDAQNDQVRFYRAVPESDPPQD